MAFLRRLWFLLRRDRLDDELREEMAFHLEERARQLAAQGGLDAEEARHAARRAFGNATLAREESRAHWGFRTLDVLAQDVRYAFRTLARQPLLVAIAVVSLGSAMAAGAAVFSLADAVLFAKLPVPHPDRLVVLRWVAGRASPYESLDGWNTNTETESTSTSFSYEAFLAARDAARRVKQGTGTEVFGFADLYQVSVAVAGEPQVATGQLVSGSYYRALGLRPAAGRLIGEADDRVSASDSVAVISHAYWQRRFGAALDVIGRPVRVNGVPTIIIGVAPAGFNGTRQVGDTADISLPLALRDRYVREPGRTGQGTAEVAQPSFDPRYWWVVMMARLGDGLDATTLQAGLDATIRQAVARSNPAVLKERFRVELLPGARGQFEQRGELVEPTAIMGGIASVVILIACANLACLLLARGAARDREMAVRLALGASRGRVVKQQLVESAIIGLAAGSAGILVARWLAEGLVPALGFEPGSPGIHVAITGRVLAFGFVASLLSTLLFGLLPALRSSAVPAVRSIRGKADISGAFAMRGSRLRLARAVLMAQVALSVVVLVAAGLLVHSIRNLERVNPGFDPRGVLLFRLDPALLGYEADRIRDLSARVLQRVRELPGVEGASLSQHGLLYGWSSSSRLGEIEGRPPARGFDVNRLIVEEEFFQTFRIPVLAGHTFNGAERPSPIVPVVINRTFAEQGFSGLTSAVGKVFKLGTAPGRPTYRVQAIVGDISLVRLNRPVPPTVFFSYRTEILHGATYAVRTATGRPEDLADSVRAAAAAVDHDVPVDRVRTQEAEIARSLRDERLFAILAAVLGGLALLLACVGIYGLMAYAVARRTQEIGVRMALGAERRGVLLMVVGDAARLTVVGLALGLAVSFASSRYLQSRLFGLTPTDPLSQVGAATLLLATALVAAFLPALRASRVDPMVALRAE